MSLPSLLASGNADCDDLCFRLPFCHQTPFLNVIRTVQYAYLNPSNLTNAFPFFGGVHDVASFDAGALDYFSDVHEFKTTKFIEQLSCYNASTAVIRWERTVLCSMWVNEHWSLQCLGLYSEIFRRPIDREG